MCYFSYFLIKILKTIDTQNKWIHIAPAINKDLKTWFENIGWTKHEDWTQISQLIFDFVNNCVENPDSLSINCQNFYRSQHSKGLQTGFITPILNALKPDNFILINNKSRVVINYFLGAKYSQKLIDYPAINKLEFCQKAANCKDKCVLIIDEINRANLSEVFGELMYLLEYREQEIYLAGSQSKFKIPDNVYLIGTMNTADRSIALVDFALRRRFAFIKIAPNYETISKFHQQHTKLKVDGLTTTLKELNQVIDDENYHLGISFFLTEHLAADIEDIWRMEIEPYLEEYFFDRTEQVEEFRWKKVKAKILPLDDDN